jgi:hypothetical protein
MDGLHDFRVRPAPTEVAAHGSHYRFIGWIAVTREQRDRGKHLARRAEAALRGVVVCERGLNRMRRGSVRDPLDGGDHVAFVGTGEREA